MFQIGDFEIHILSGGHLYVDAGGPFGLVPRVLWSRFQAPTDDHLLPMCLNCVLIKAHGKNILADVGMGNKVDEKYVRRSRLTHPQGTVYEGLARLGLTVDDIDMVINTHLHADHCENNTMFKDGQIVPTFPNAEYVVQQREYDDAMQPNERTRATYIPVNYEPVMQAGQMRLVDGDIELFPGIKGVLTPGHTPGHMSVLISTDDSHVFFACDLVTYAIQLEKLAWITAYDVEPLVTLETKRKWQPWLAENNAITIFPHDTTILAARLVSTEEGGYQMVPLEASDGADYS